MVLKDWEKIKKGDWTYRKDEEKYHNFEKRTFLTIKRHHNNKKIWVVDITPKSEKPFWKNFKTKTSALKFAREYMKKY